MADHAPLPRWIVIWLAVSTLVVLWDAAFVLLRPASFPGESLGYFWSFAYGKYLEVDHGYADLQNTFVSSLAIMSLLESILVAATLIYHRLKRNRLAHLFALVVTSLTGAKTTLFFIHELNSGGTSIGHNDIIPMTLFWSLPNGLWILIPFTIAIVTGRTLLQGAPRHPLKLHATETQ